MRMPALLIATLCTVSMPVAYAQDSSAGERSIELALSDTTLQLRYLTDADAVNVDNGRLVFGAFLSEERDVVGTAALMVPIDWSFGPLSFDVGPQVYAALLDEENNDVFAVAFGAEVRFDLNRSNELAIVGSGYYAPDILTFGSADKITDLSARAEARLTPHLLGFVGFRWFELDLLMTRDRKLQDELFAGVRWRFQ